MERGTGQPDAASDHRRRAIRKLSLQRSELPRRRHHRMAYPRLRPDLGGYVRTGYGRDREGRVRDNHRRRRAHQGRRAPLARCEGGFADVAYHGYDRRQQVRALTDDYEGPSAAEPQPKVGILTTKRTKSTKEENFFSDSCPLRHPVLRVLRDLCG